MSNVFSYNPADWYWTVGGHPGVVFSSAVPDYVSTSDPTYADWVAAGNTATEVPNDGTLALVLVQSDQNEAALVLDPTDFSGLSDFNVARGAIAAGCYITRSNAASITGSISGTTLTVTSVAEGVLHLGDTLTGSGLISGSTNIVGFLTGTGGTGTYLLSRSQTVLSGSINADAYYAGAYDTSGVVWSAMLMELQYVDTYGAFDNGQTTLQWLFQDRSTSTTFASTADFKTAVRALMDYILAWERWIVTGGASPDWGVKTL